MQSLIWSNSEVYRPDRRSNGRHWTVEDNKVEQRALDDDGGFFFFLFWVRKEEVVRVLSLFVFPGKRVSVWVSEVQTGNRRWWEGLIYKIHKFSFLFFFWIYKENKKSNFQLYILYLLVYIKKNGIWRKNKIKTNLFF